MQKINLKAAANRKNQTKRALRARALVVPLAAAGFFSQRAWGTSGTWLVAPTDNTWEASGAENNWSTGVATYPGITGTTTNTDNATFNNASSITAISISPSPLNIGSITFDTAAAGPYVIGTTAGNALLLTTGGTIQTTATVANIETVNAPLTLEPASSSTAGSYTLSSNATSSTAVLDIGGAFTTATTSAADTLNFAGTNTGANTFSGTLSDSGSGGLNVNFSGLGNWTYGGTGVSTLAKGTIVVSNSTFNFGVAGGGNSPSLTTTNSISGGGTGFLISGNKTVFNMVSGSLAIGDTTYGLLFSGQGGQTFNQTGGAISTNGLIGFSDSGASYTTTVNISGGALTTTRSDSNAFTLATRGFTTATLSGTATVTAPIFNMTTSQIGAGSYSTGGSIFNLGNGVSGGLLVTGQVIAGTGSAGTTFNFNGGTLRASASSTTFFGTTTQSTTSAFLTNAIVKVGGAFVDTQAFNDTITQPLLHDSTLGATADGGLTKLGSGILTLGGVSTYTGMTTISAGTLQLGDGTSADDGTINNTSGITDNATLAFDRFGTQSSGVVISGSGGVTKLGAGLQVLNGANTYTGNTIVNAGTLTIGDGTNGSITTGTGTLSIGNVAGNSVLNINSGLLTDTTNLTFIGSASGAASALNLTSGTFTSTLADGDGNGGVFGNTGYGAPNVSGGTLNLARIYVGSGNTGATGVVNISGGSVKVTGGFDFIINRGSTATDVVTVSGGTLTTTASGLYVGFQSTGGAQLNVTGGTINNSGRTLNYGNSWTGTGIVNLNAGTLQTNTIATGGGTDLLNFNGGTLEGGTAGSTTFIPSTVTAYVNGAFGTSAGGAVINTNSLNETVVAPLLAPTGNGVTTVAVTGGTGYVGAPYVAITGGGGTGATAIATIDGSGNLTGITVTNPGVNYTGTPTFTLTGGGGTGAVPGTVTTAANTSGGLTKNGAGMLTLSGTSTYNGATSISAGTLAIATGGLISSSGTINLTAATGAATLQLLNATGTNQLSPGATVNVTSTTNVPTINIPAGGFDTVSAFTINGMPEAPGLYSGANNATAGFEPTDDPTLFTGGGTLDVTPEPGSFSILGIGVIGLLSRRKRQLQRGSYPAIPN